MKNRRKTGFAKCRSVGFTSVRQKVVVGSMEKFNRRFLVGTTVRKFTRVRMPIQTYKKIEMIVFYFVIKEVLKSLLEQIIEIYRI